MAGASSNDRLFLSRAVEATVRIGLLAALVAWCFAIVRPFVVPVAWAVVIATAVHPLHRRLRTALGERGRLAAALLTLLGLLLLIVPTLLLGETLVEGTGSLAAGLRAKAFAIPAPPQGVRDWPLVGEQVHAYWAQASENLRPTLEALQPQLVAFGSWLLATAAGAGFALLQFVLSILIAGVLLANDAGGSRVARSISRRLAGERGPEFADLAGVTVRSVAQGILGVALIQSFLAGLGFLAVGVPGAGLWALVGLLLCVVQIGLLPLALPLVIYAFATAEPLVAGLFTVWTVLVSLLDNVLKPLIFGRGVQVPTLVIFLGSIGGFLSAGIIGLFVGPVVLVLGYSLFRAWLEEVPPSSEAVEAAPLDS